VRILKDLSDAARTGLVISRTRKYAEILTSHAQHRHAEVAKPLIDEICVGDICRYDIHGEKTRVVEALPRKNLFARHLGAKSRKVAANLDALFIITAPPPLYNTEAIDRMLLAATEQNIPVILVLNKVDLLPNAADRQFLLAPYSSLCQQQLEYSTQQNSTEGKTLMTALHALSGDIFAFAGVSGVGKSSILKTLLPNASFRTAETSDRTGQGRQTTSQAQGYLWQTEATDRKSLFIDLPGIQAFGISQLPHDRVRELFPDFHEAAHHCAFLDCSHIGEEDCGVKAAVEEGEIFPSRYISYMKILEEIERNKPY
jgi:ribosome biogenesis GTPase